MWATKNQATLRNVTEERIPQSNVYKVIKLRPFDIHLMHLAQIYEVQYDLVWLQEFTKSAHNSVPMIY